MRRVIQTDPKAEFYRNASPTVAVRENIVELIFETEGDRYCVVNLSSTKDSVVILARIGDADFSQLLTTTLTGIDGWENDIPALHNLLSGKTPYCIATITNADGRTYSGVLRRIFGRQKEMLDLIGDKVVRKEAFNVGQIALVLQLEFERSSHPAIRNLSTLFFG